MLVSPSIVNFKFRNCVSYSNEALKSIKPGVPRKVKCLFDHRTKCLCSIIKFSFDSNKKHSDLDFETKFTQFQHKLTDISQLQNWQVDFNLKNFADSQGIDFHYACTLNNMPL